MGVELGYTFGRRAVTNLLGMELGFRLDSGLRYYHVYLGLWKFSEEVRFTDRLETWDTIFL